MALFPEPIFILFTLPLTFETHALNLLETWEVLEDLMVIGGVGGGWVGEGEIGGWLKKRLGRMRLYSLADSWGPIRLFFVLY